MNDPRLFFSFALAPVLGGTLSPWTGMIGVAMARARARDSLTWLQATLACAGAALTALGIHRIRCQTT